MISTFNSFQTESLYSKKPETLSTKSDVITVRPCDLLGGKFKSPLSQCLSWTSLLQNKETSREKQRYRTGNFQLEPEPMMDLLILTNQNEGLVSIYNLKCFWADLHCMFVVHFIFIYESLTVKDNIRTK